MKHIKNFRNFTINEGNDFMFIRSNKPVHQGLGEMIANGVDKFYKDFSGIMGKIKNYLGKKFEEFKTYLTTISLGIGKLDKSQLKEMASSVENHFGEKSNDEIQDEVEQSIKSQMKEKKDGETASKTALQKIFGKTAMFLAPIVTPMVHKVQVASDKVASSLNTPIDAGTVNMGNVLSIAVIIILAIVLIRMAVKSN
jgi:hypothetical protein